MRFILLQLSTAYVIMNLSKMNSLGCRKSIFLQLDCIYIAGPCCARRTRALSLLPFGECGQMGAAPLKPRYFDKGFGNFAARGAAWAEPGQAISSKAKPLSKSGLSTC